MLNDVSEKLRRELHPEIRVLDEARGLVEYVASDETLDSFREVIRADGWRFNRFTRNAPFVDSHDYRSIDKLLGRVTDFCVSGRKLVETVRWAIDVPDARLARYGFEMTRAGYLKAISPGFFVTRAVSRWDLDPSGWREQLADLGYTEENGPLRIFTEQEQVELSACVIGANPNALARAYKAGVLDDSAIDFLSSARAQSDSRPAAASPDDAARLTRQARERFLRRFTRLVSRL